MVAKQSSSTRLADCSYLLAKIHMVAKLSNGWNYVKAQLSSSKNPYGSKTSSVNPSNSFKLSSSKNPYGSKTAYHDGFFFIKLSSSKNPYGSKTIAHISNFQMSVIF